MRNMPLTITLLFTVIIIIEWSNNNSRHDSVRQVLEMPLRMPKSSRSGIFSLSDDQVYSSVDIVAKFIASIILKSSRFFDMISIVYLALSFLAAIKCLCGILKRIYIVYCLLFIYCYWIYTYFITYLDEYTIEMVINIPVFKQDISSLQNFTLILRFYNA